MPGDLRSCGDITRWPGATRSHRGIQAALAASDDDRERAEILISWAEVGEQQAAYADALALPRPGERRAAARPDDPLAMRIRAPRLGWSRATPWRHRRRSSMPDRPEAREHWADYSWPIKSSRRLPGPMSLERRVPTGSWRSTRRARRRYS
jgi:hypothetical protein